MPLQPPRIGQLNTPITLVNHVYKSTPSPGTWVNTPIATVPAFVEPVDWSASTIAGTITQQQIRYRAWIRRRDITKTWAVIEGEASDTGWIRPGKMAWKIAIIVPLTSPSGAWTYLELENWT